jgi:hypothetical protein
MRNARLLCGAGVVSILALPIVAKAAIRISGPAK